MIKFKRGIISEMKIFEENRVFFRLYLNVKTGETFLNCFPSKMNYSEFEDKNIKEIFNSDDVYYGEISKSFIIETVKNRGF